MKIAIFLLKCAGLWLAILAGQLLSGMVAAALAHNMPPEAHDGPLTVAQALPVIAALHALVLGVLASRLAWTGWRKAAALFGVYYMVATGLSMIEAFYFNAYLKLDVSLLVGISLGDLLKACMACGAAMLLWRGSAGEPTRLGGLVWKLPVLVPLYILFYFGAGALIAWQGEAVRAYYEQGNHIDIGNLALLQVGRGAIWATLAMVLAKGLAGTRLERGVLAGLAFAVFMVAALLTPSGFMPWEVRKFHTMEITASNFLYGFLCVQILMIGYKKYIVSTTPK